MRVDYNKIAPEIKKGLDLYAAEGRSTGGFLTAVLENNLVEAVSRADSYNILTLQDIVGYLFNEMPSPSWGSAEKVTAWQRHDGLKGIAKSTAPVGGVPTVHGMNE